MNDIHAIYGFVQFSGIVGQITKQKLIDKTHRQGPSGCSGIPTLQIAAGVTFNDAGSDGCSRDERWPGLYVRRDSYPIISSFSDCCDFPCGPTFADVPGTTVPNIAETSHQFSRSGQPLTALRRTSP